MNFIQRNPSDLRHQEFHDGEYEYWPLEDSLKTKSISFPAALVSGLEMLAAVAAAGLLAVALMALYVLSSPLAISENSAVINTNIYNNQNDQDVVYTLSFLETPDNVLQDGILLHDEQTLSLWNLNGGTTYLLKYYDSEQNEVGQFRFTTPGEKPSPEEPEPPVPDQPPEELVGDMEEPVSEKEAPPEDGDEATESTTETAVPDSNRPPVIVRPRPTPRPEPEEEENTPDPEPKPEPEPEPEPKPEAVPGVTEIENLTDNSYVSGLLPGHDLAYTERFVFINIPDEGYDFAIDRAGPGNYYTKHEYINGTLTITVMGSLDFGNKITTKVTVNTSDGTKVEKQTVIAAPKLVSANIKGTANGDGTYDFKITANAQIDDDTDGVEKLILTANFSPYLNAAPRKLSMTQDPNDPTQYTAVINSVPVPSGEKVANVIVTGYWERIGPDVLDQERSAMYEYS